MQREKISNKLSHKSSEICNENRINRILFRKKHQKNKNKQLEIKNTTEMRNCVCVCVEKVQEVSPGVELKRQRWKTEQ